MITKTMFPFLLFLFPVAVDAKLSDGSNIIGGNTVYENALNKFLGQAVGKDRHWSLCYRASSDGWMARTFHEKCDEKSNTVTIIKVGDYVFGGYTDIPWDTSGTHGSTAKAFLFSLKNNEGLGPFKSPVKTPKYAIYKDSFYGPTFGRGYDIQIDSMANRNRYSYTNYGDSYYVPPGVEQPYTVLAGTYTFSPDEVEVFYLD